MDLTAEAALSWAVRLLDQLKKRQGDIEARDAYYRGEQKLKFATDEWAKAHAGRYKDFSDNWCGVVADSPAERVAVTGFRLDDSAALSPEEQQLWRDWLDNDLDAQSAQGFLESFIAARSFVIVWGDDDDNPVVTWEHPSQVLVAYDPDRPRQRTAAIKSWFDDEDEFLTLYTPTQVWKWQRPRSTTSETSGSGLYVVRFGFGTGGWEPREVDDVWPVPNPMGVVPVVEVANRPRLASEPMSDIAGTMAMQDAINLLWAYLFNAADYASMPARVVMGQAPPKIPILDADGNKVGEREVEEETLKQGRLLWLTGQNASIGTFPSATLTVFTDVAEVAVGHVAAQTRTPQHYLIGKMANLSGDALVAAETGLVKKAEESCLHFTSPVREVFRLMALVRGNDDVATAAARGTVKWKDAASRSEAQQVDALQKLKDIGFPFEYLAERLGLSDTELARVLKMRDDAAARILAGDLSSLVGPKPAADGAVTG